MTVSATRTNIYVYDAPQQITSWTFAADDTGEAEGGAGWADRSLQVAGTFGSGTLTWQGSNDGTNWVTLTDPLGNNLTFTAVGIKQILQVCRFMRPSFAGSTAPTLTVTLLLTRSK